MTYDILIGRDTADKERFGDKGLIYLGRGYVKMGNYTSLSNKIWMDVARSHVILIAGKRGSGKSYTLGAIAEGDIGQHFPPTDPQWRGASSDHFVQFALDRLHQRGGQMLHADITLVAEAPRIGPHRKTMIETLSRLLQLPEQRIGLKATTSESMGFTGRKEGLAASVVVTVRLPEKDDLHV